MPNYAIYLRKSRKDAEAEAHGEGETLARHEKTLLELAKRKGLNVTQIYREVVSGETIAARPVMQQLLQAVEQGIWSGVLVMEVERLARGDTIDQGIVAQTFKYSNTEIITPVKNYNPNDEYDEEYFEFGLFMSRREYKTINRRLQRGRIASIKEGKYVGNRPPYGYERVHIANDKGFTLKPIPNEADVVRLIFEWYTSGIPQDDGSVRRIGTLLIAKRLNEMKIPTQKGNEWTVPSVRDILNNPVYIGKVRWNWRSSVKKMVDGKITISRPRNADVLLYKGLHPAIVSEDVYNKAQEYMRQNPPRPVPKEKTVQNPLAGIVVCGTCGKKMVRRPYKSDYPDTLMCPKSGCENVSSDLQRVEKHILKGLAEWLKDYRLLWEESELPKSIKQSDIQRKNREKQQKELDTLYKQLSKTHDLLEQGIYDTDTFLDRSRDISERINQAKENIAQLDTQIKIETAREENTKNVIPKVEHLLQVYHTLPNAQAKNNMLKDVLEKVVYLKKKRAYKKTDSLDDFEITLFPKIPPLS